MLTTSKQMILDAQRGGYAVGSFNTSDLEITKAIVKAAQHLNSPIIVETSEKAIAYAGLEELATIVVQQAGNVQVPVALHLDHGSSLDIVSQCLNAGYTSIMFDGSKLPINENQLYTRHAVEMAQRGNIPCEGELGNLDGNYTDANEVRDFVKFTGVDFLAVAIGSKHGIQEDENLDIELLKKIRRKTSIPLVLHGASGVPEEDIKLAIYNGICKVNIDTDIRHTFSKAIREIVKIHPEISDPKDIMQKVMTDIQELVEGKIKLFGSENKAH